MQLGILEYLYAKSLTSNKFDSSPNCNTISLLSKLSNSTSNSIATHELCPNPLQLSKETLSKASGFCKFPFPIKKSLFPVYDFIFSLLDTNATLFLKLSLYKFFAITKLFCLVISI